MCLTPPGFCPHLDPASPGSKLMENWVLNSETDWGVYRAILFVPVSSVPTP